MSSSTKIDCSPAGRTFSFAVDDVFYKIDLSTQNIAEFKSAVDGFMKALERSKAVAEASADRSRRVGAGGGRRSREQIRAVRDWARRHGYSHQRAGQDPRVGSAGVDQAHAAT